MAMNRLTQKLLVGAGAGLAAIAAGRAILARGRRFSYRGKVVIVTGGSRGLGLVLARQLAAQGAKVAICARGEEELKRAAGELRQIGEEQNFLAAIPCDVSDQGQVQTMVAQVVDQWGTVDLLFNDAGIIEVGPLDTMTVDDFHRSMETHCFGALHTVLAVLPEMRRKRWGRIVNIASIGGKVAVPHLLPYSASKFALVGLSHGLRAELMRDGILVTTVCPGLMRTGSPRNASFKGQHRKEYAWFSVSDSLPLLSMSVETAARKILRACQRGDAELILTAPAIIGAMLQTLAPNLASGLTSLANRLLPSIGGIDRHSARGYESESWVSPSVLTRLSDEAAKRNNEFAPTPNR
jgi:NAD(P)-dependent dehydrogenase (short-subunit alcohol dehydrogenase family)